MLRLAQAGLHADGERGAAWVVWRSEAPHQHRRGSRQVSQAAVSGRADQCAHMLLLICVLANYPYGAVASIGCLYACIQGFPLFHFSSFLKSDHSFCVSLISIESLSTLFNCWQFLHLVLFLRPGL